MSEESSYKLMGPDARDGSFNKGSALVKKRSEKGYLKDRFSKIVSVYVPNDDAEKVLLKFNDDAEADVQEHRRRTLLQSLDNGLSYEVELLGSLKTIIGRDTGRVKCAAVYSDQLFVSFEAESQIFRLCVSEDGVHCDSIWSPKFHGLSLIPTEIRVSGEFIFVSGTISSDELQWIIIKYDHSERMVACTKRYSHHKFGRFDIDLDGNLVLLSPRLSADGFVSQISKLSESFETRQYHISLGDNQFSYQPLYVAAHGPRGLAWVTMTKKCNEKNDEEEYRIMCFHCCIDSCDGDKERLRSALASNRWRMAGHKLGVVASLGDHVLAIDEELRNLCLISWEDGRDQPSVKKISAPGSPNLIYLCSNGANGAFLFTEQSIFLFKFHEQLIKDSEILV